MASVEVDESPVRGEEPKSPHKTKKRKHRDSDQRRSSSKKPKHLDNDANLETDAPGTPILSSPSNSKKKSKPHKTTLRSSPSRPSPQPELDHEVSLPKATHLSNGVESPTTNEPQAPTTTTSPFYRTTASLYLPLPAIALSPTTALPSLITTHLTPLLLTYFPPLRGIILGLSNPVLSSEKPDPKSAPHPLNSAQEPNPRIVLAHCADDAGLSYIWLTATYLVFRPQSGDELAGWVNVCSEGFVGLVCYNYFQVAVARDRIPSRWRWVMPGGEEARAKKARKSEKKKNKKKERRKQGGGFGYDGLDEAEAEVEAGNGTSQETLVDGMDGVVEEEAEDEAVAEDGGERETGYFLREDGTKVTGSINFRVVDCEIVPGHDRDTWSLQIEGTLLSPEEEEMLVETEREKAIRRQEKAVMSGGLRNGTFVNQSQSRSGRRESTPI